MVGESESWAIKENLEISKARKTELFILLLIPSLAGLLISIWWVNAYYTPRTVSQDWMAGMMSRMMGPGSMLGPSVTPTPSPYVWVTPIIFLSLTMVGIVGLAYTFFETHEKTYHEVTVPSPSSISPSAEPRSLSLVFKTLKGDERSVIEILKAHDGKCLQKDISREASMNRTKTHRVVKRLAERGIVTVKELGKTNEVALSDWLQSSSSDAKNQPQQTIRGG